VLETGNSLRQEAPGGIFRHSSVAAVFRAVGAEKFANLPYNMARETGNVTTRKARNGESGSPKLETGKATPPPWGAPEGSEGVREVS
jgi:hypothetical protein